MQGVEKKRTDFQRGLEKLGFRRNDDALFLTSENQEFTEPHGSSLK